MRIYVTPDGKRYGFLPHALDRMSQRQIKRRDIEAILDDYQTHYRDRKGNSCFIGLSTTRRKIRIVVVKDSNPMEILTVIAPD